MSEDISVRWMLRRRDVVPVSEMLWKQQYPDFIDYINDGHVAEIISELISNKRVIGLVAEKENILRGFLIYIIHPRYFVVPIFCCERQEVGEVLLEHMFKKIRNGQRTAMFIRSDYSLSSANALKSKSLSTLAWQDDWILARFPEQLEAPPDLFNDYESMLK